MRKVCLVFYDQYDYSSYEWSEYLSCLCKLLIKWCLKFKGKQNSVSRKPINLFLYKCFNVLFTLKLHSFT